MAPTLTLAGMFTGHFEATRVLKFRAACGDFDCLSLSAAGAAATQLLCAVNLPE